MKRNIILLFMTLFMTLSCSFLEEAPDRSGNATINTMEQLYQLMGNSGFYNDMNYLWTENLLFSDDVTFSPYVYQKTGNAKAYLVSVADRDFLQNDPTMTGMTWNAVYRNMFTFNVVLEHLDKVEQSTPQIKEQVRGEALFNRAWFHFFGLVDYCGYDPASPGIGYKDNTLAAPDGIPARQTAAYTISRIREDLSAAEQALSAAGRTAFELEKNFRVTLPALYAAQARVELYLGNFEAAQKAAEKALEGHDALHRIPGDPMYVKSVVKSFDILGEDGKPTGEKIDFRDFKTDLNAQFGGDTFFLEYEELYLPQFTVDKLGGSIHPVSESLYNLFDREHDSRWKCFYDNNYMVSYGSFAGGGFDREEQEKLKEWERHVYLRFNFFGNRVLILGPTTAEMYLILAECHARKGDAAKAKEYLVTLRKSRFTDEESAAKIEGTLQDVLDERRREFAGMLRFYDLKRLNFGTGAGISYTKAALSDPYDFNSEVIQRPFAADDARLFTFPIPESERVLLGWNQN